MKSYRRAVLPLCVVALLAAASFVLPIAAQQQTAAPVKDIKALRNEYWNMQDQVTALYEAKIPPEAYKTVELADGTKMKIVDKNHPAYQEVKGKWEVEMGKLDARYAEVDTRYTEVREVKGKLGLKDTELFYSGTERPGGCPGSDVDLTGTKEACEKFIAELKANNPGIEVKEIPGGWEIPGKDMKLLTSEASTAPTIGSEEYFREKAQLRSDKVAPEGAMWEVTKGKMGINDPEGAVTGFTQKFLESGVTGNPMTMDEHVAAKCLDKAGSATGVNAEDPGFFEKLKLARNHKNFKRAGLVDFGNQGDAEALQKKMVCDKMKEKMIRCYEKGKGLSAELDAARDVKIKQLTDKGNLTIEEATELTRLQNEKSMTKLSNQVTLEEMSTWDPEFISEMVGGEKITKVVEKNGSVRYLDAAGKEIPPEALVERVMVTIRPGTSGGVRGAVRTFFGQPTGAGATFVRVATPPLLMLMAWEGLKGAWNDIDPNDRIGVIGLKFAGNTVLHALGIPELWKMGREAGNESMDQYNRDLINGKDPSYWWAKLRGAGWGLKTMGKAMVVDPCVSIYQARKSYLEAESNMWTTVIQNWKAREETQVRIDAYREQVLGKERERLEAALNRAEALLQNAEAAGDAEGVRRAKAAIEEIRKAITLVDAARAGEGANLDERVQRFKEAASTAGSAFNTVVVLGRSYVAASQQAEKPNFNLPPAPPPGNRAAITKWRDDCLASLQKQMDADPLRADNKRRATAEGGKPKKITCKRCGYSEEHWWFGDRWSCPGCETCTMPSDLKRGDGLTYREYAAQRMKIYQDEMERVRQQAADLLNKGTSFF